MTRRQTTPPAALARGPGPAGHGAAHWWAQRASAVALIPLVVWLVVALMRGAGADHAAFTAWLDAPLNVVMMTLLLLAAFHHAALGLQVVAEDYGHTATRFAVVMAIHLACVAGAVGGIVAVLLVSRMG